MRERTIHVSEAFAPIVIVTMLREPQDEDVDWYLDYVGEVHRRRTPFALVYDLTKVLSAKATHRQRKADFLKEYAPLTREHCAGVSFAVSSPLIRGLLTAVFWVQPMACPYDVFASVDRCMLWTRERLGDKARAASES